MTFDARVDALESGAQGPYLHVIPLPFSSIQSGKRRILAPTGRSEVESSAFTKLRRKRNYEHHQLPPLCTVPVKSSVRSFRELKKTGGARNLLRTKRKNRK